MMREFLGEKSFQNICHSTPDDDPDLLIEDKFHGCAGCTADNEFVIPGF